tara:strand:+ start:4089 stop:4868 length:780 start_codon:yes stop_codon:yes gene_type:complete
MEKLEIRNCEQHFMGKHETSCPSQEIVRAKFERMRPVLSGVNKDGLDLKIKVEVHRIGSQPYEPVWETQKDLVKKRHLGLIPDSLIMVEHEPVYTVGKNGNDNHLLQSRRPDVPIFQIERGGDVTYHGPGQIVGYPILDLHDHKMSISWYMRSLEEVIINSLSQFGIAAERRNGLTGVWVGDMKIAALGVRISRWVTMHGFALNVNTDLSYFDGIIPCGIFEYGVTSMEMMLGEKIALPQVEEVLIKEFMKTFNFNELN